MALNLWSVSAIRWRHLLRFETVLRSCDCGLTCGVPDFLHQSARAREGRVKSEAGFVLDRAPTYFFARAIRKLFDLFKVTQTILAQRFDCDAGGVYASNSDVTTMFSSRARVKRCAIRRESRREARTAPAASMRPTPNSRCHLLPIMVYRGEFRAQSARTRTKSEQREIASLNPERTPRVAA